MERNRSMINDGDVQILHGDALETLRTLPDCSVQMIASSPPFWGLRDYGTGRWEGGDADCDHKMDAGGGNRRGEYLAAYVRPDSGKPTGGAKKMRTEAGSVYGATCGKCGAKRVDNQIGLEETPDEWCSRLVAVYRECRRVLRDDGCMFIEIGDSYAGGNAGGTYDPDTRKPGDGSGGNASWTNREQRTTTSTSSAIPAKNLIGQPWLLAFALRADGWYLRSEIIWARPNPMPESVTDRPTKAHSTVFLLTKKPRYYYDADAIREPYIIDGRKVTTVKGTDASEQHRDGERWPNPVGANSRSVWTLATEPTPFAHFATWPQTLIERMIKAGTSEHGCCSACGAPWVRVTEQTIENPGNRSTNGRRERDSKMRGFDVRREVTSTTTGWDPTCACNTATVPCVVMDPFMGSGTTALVARRLGRHAIGIELNADYIQIARDRLQQLSLFAPPPPVNNEGAA